MRGEALSKSEVTMLRGWDSVARFLRRRYAAQGGFEFKDTAFRQVYGQLIREALRLLPANPAVLKTDLWNEGVEKGRELASFAMTENHSGPVCIDVSRYICECANSVPDHHIQILRATLLGPPFRPLFDLILDASTVDHLPQRLREIWITAESSILRENGLLLISFDCKLNLLNELYHRLHTRKIYPEWTILPSEIRAQLASLGFTVIREHAIFIAGFFWGTHRPLFPFARILRRKGVFDFLTKTELSRRSRWLSFIAPQYVIVARKKNA